MRLYFARHGESEANVSGIFSNRGWMHPLTALGHQQANALAARMQAEKLTAIYSSPLMRAIETAEIVGRVLDLPVTAEPALREYDVGVHEGLPYFIGKPEYDRVAADWLAGELDSRIEGGESAIEIIDRMNVLLKRLRTTHAEGDRLLLVSHGGLLGTALPRLLTGLTTTMTLAGLGHCDTAIADLFSRRFLARSWGPATIS
ncbi:MAG: histidine phosphatase family protein [Devosia sp.]